VLDGLFPDDVVTAWGDPADSAGPLFPEEEALVARAVPKRRREFAKGRECARNALGRLGFGEVMLLSGESREPLWPAGAVGSITHTAGLCAVAVARSDGYAGIGIDAEPAAPLAADIAKRVSGPHDERSFTRVSSLDGAVLPRLVFSVKEAVYKCLFPITRVFLGFDDVNVELDEGTFRARLRPAAKPFSTGSEFIGRWRKVDAFLVTAAWIERSD
jgi:4'-phosphopantetheinyl transferase EntD